VTDADALNAGRGAAAHAYDHAADAQKAHTHRVTVFNAEQCDGLPDTAFATPEPLPDCQTIPRAENADRRHAGRADVGHQSDSIQ
jgi:antirestriction protein ArdC